MHTFNISIVFGEAEFVYTIVCASEELINEQEVNFVATAYFKIAMDHYKSTDQVIKEITEGIKKECGCNAVIVKADAAVLIPRK